MNIYKAPNLIISPKRKVHSSRRIQACLIHLDLGRVYYALNSDRLSYSLVRPIEKPRRYYTLIADRLADKAAIINGLRVGRLDVLRGCVSDDSMC